MKIYVQQSIHIHILRVESISNSSVLQIGTAGIIKSKSNLFNTGGFTGPAPVPEYEGFVTPIDQPIVVPFQS